MIVNTKVACDSKKILLYLNILKEKYPFINVLQIGESSLGNKIYAVKIGEGETNDIFVGSHHGMEWITSLLLMKFIEDFCEAKTKGKSILGYDPSYIFKTRCSYFVPMLNPDGVDIALKKVPTDKDTFERILAICPYDELSQKWQANARGVDLNHNYNADFEKGVEIQKNTGTFTPSASGFSGEYYESEAETSALTKFVRQINPKFAFAYHSQGEEIYSDFNGKMGKGGKEIANILSAVTGYKKSSVDGYSAIGGFKDWFISEFDKPAFTIEVGMGKNPLPIDSFDDIYMKNIEGILLSMLI